MNSSQDVMRDGSSIYLFENVNNYSLFLPNYKRLDILYTDLQRRRTVNYDTDVKKAQHFLQIISVGYHISLPLFVLLIC
jgi:hypothetical protein